jgi:nucleotide-binding universal stress UspA family protein
MADWHKVLCPVDFSLASEQALHTAVRLAAGLYDELWLLHAFEVPLVTWAPEFVPPPPETYEPLRQDLTQRLEEWAERARSWGATLVHAQVDEAPAVQAILTEAQRVGADLIVMGTHGRTGLRHALLGSVAERVVQRANCPVLTVHAPEQAAHPV